MTSEFQQQIQQELERVNLRYGHPSSFFFIPYLTNAIQREIWQTIDDIEQHLDAQPTYSRPRDDTYGLLYDNVPCTDQSDPGLMATYNWESSCSGWMASLRGLLERLAALLDEADPNPENPNWSSGGLGDLVDRAQTFEDREEGVTPGFGDVVAATPDWVKGLMFMLTLLVVVNVMGNVRR